MVGQDQSSILDPHDPPLQVWGAGHWGELVQWEDAFSHTFHACLVRATGWQNRTLAPGLDLSLTV